MFTSRDQNHMNSDDGPQLALQKNTASCVADADILFYHCGFYLSSFFFPRLFSTVGDCMSTIHLHMMWP